MWLSGTTVSLRVWILPFLCVCVEFPLGLPGALLSVEDIQINDVSKLPIVCGNVRAGSNGLMSHSTCLLLPRKVSKLKDGWISTVNFVQVLPLNQHLYGVLQCFYFTMLLVICCMGCGS